MLRKMLLKNDEGESVTFKIEDDVIAIYQTERNIKFTIQVVGLGCDPENKDYYILYGHVKKFLKFVDEVTEISIRRFNNSETINLVNEKGQDYSITVGDKLIIRENGQAKELIGIFVNGNRSFYVLENIRSPIVNRSW